MSCKSALYAVNNSLPTIPAAGVIPFGTVIRRFGCNIQLAGTGVTLSGAGYYDVDVSVTLSPSAIGTVTVSLLKDGVLIPGASAAETVTAAGDTVNLSFSAIVRLQCCEDTSTLTLVLSGGAATINNASIVVEKL